MNSTSFNEILKPLGFDVDSVPSGLFFTSRDYKSNEIDFSELLVLEEAERLKATAVFFRRMEGLQSSIPQVFIYDNTSQNYTENDWAEIHKKIWSSGIVPIYYIVDNTQIRIFDGRKPVNYRNNKPQISPFDTIELVSATQDLYEKYSANLFLNGSFWEQDFTKNHFLSSKSAENKLIEGLRKRRTQFLQETKLDKDLAHRLLVLSILIKYLEERKDEKGKHVFPPDFFHVYNESVSFCDVIRNGKLVELFKDLSSRFNGKIYELNEKDEKQLQKTNLEQLADYLDANIENDQYVFWKLYSFEYLPVEIISRIYQEFITHRGDAVYTPTHLARFMVDECMPLNEVKNNFRVIDVSCGSGIFLVTAFKRLVQWWQKEQFDKTGLIKKPKIGKLKSILLRSIYGIDLEKDAVRLSIFSLSIALCDMLSPTEIWTELKFEVLEGSNLFNKDFFDYLTNDHQEGYDLVIGNPPFKDKINDFDGIISKYKLDVPYSIPRHQIAILFLQQSVKLLKKDGLLSLVMPSGPLLYNETGAEFRREFFSEYEIPQIIDFSSLDKKSMLFESAVATSVIFVNNKQPKDDHQLLHVTVKRTRAAKDKLYFEVDHYDLHHVPQEIAIDDKIIWKTNLMGGGQLYYLLKRLQSIRTLGDYLKEKKKKNGWSFAEGYVYAKGTDKAPHLTGQKMVETDSFTEEGILETKTEEETHFYRSSVKNKKIFTPPHLLIKETPGERKFITFFSEEYLIFRNEIFGIHAPKEYKEQLKKIEQVLQNNYLLFKTLLLSFSSRAGISRSASTVLMKDFLALPYPEDEKELKLTKNEKIVIEDVLNYRIEELSKGEQAGVNIKKVNAAQLKEFGKVLCSNLNSIYKANGNQFNPLKPIQTKAYTCYPFSYGGNENVKEELRKLSEKDIVGLIDKEKGTAYYRRVLKIYQNEKEIFYLIKPNTLRYWLKSVALRDAGEIMIDLINSGY
ncbi:MAG: SAM-dependent methyltransferase [Melioribacteraceae bacterium]|nr:SAM-dependent methyltransferase [Melioribacteraceae bacterium]MCF8356818.1 SAM-dependent methyltransferase [Melioribacteraceae bacterium]MCF8396187.1 SAM-dependent methyltransferase [Melioribacteraceae bacterium]MCF8421143.1 SAM-dependent methyltransferase [Melioribacteraceae bacterium]